MYCVATDIRIIVINGIIEIISFFSYRVPITQIALIIQFLRCESTNFL